MWTMCTALHPRALFKKVHSLVLTVFIFIPFCELQENPWCKREAKTSCLVQAKTRQQRFGNLPSDSLSKARSVCRSFSSLRRKLTNVNELEAGFSECLHRVSRRAYVVTTSVGFALTLFCVPFVCDGKCAATAAHQGAAVEFTVSSVYARGHTTEGKETWIKCTKAL